MELTINRVVKNWQYAPKIVPSTDLDEYVHTKQSRRFAMQPDAPFWKEAFAEYGLEPTEVEPMFQNMTINHYEDNGYTHEHIDVTKEGFTHARCNVVLKMPPLGGHPIIDGEPIMVGLHDMWLCLASMENHASAPIKGGQRTVFSFGAYVPNEQIEKIIKRD
jgi:hypothetical protein